MRKTGVITYAKYSNFTVINQTTGKPNYWHDIEMNCNGENIIFSYVSITENQTNFVVGKTADVELTEHTSKAGKPYLKGKPARDEFQKGGNGKRKEDPRDTIRSIKVTALEQAIRIKEHISKGEFTELGMPVSSIAKELEKKILEKSDINAFKGAMFAQSAMKVTVLAIVAMELTTLDKLFERYSQFYEFITK